MQARSLLFTLYGDFVQRYGSEVWIGTLIQALGEFGHNPQAVRMAISRATQDGLLQGRKLGNRSYYSLTERGKRRLEDGVRRVYRQSEEPWDGTWRFLTLTGPEGREIRHQLRLELNWSGFTPLTPTLWLSPRAAEEIMLDMVREHGDEEHIHIFVGRYRGPQTDRELAAHAWNLAALARHYDAFIAQVQERIEPLRSELQTATLPDNRCFVERLWLVHEYRKFLHLDPGLPRELLPERWPGDAAREQFWDYYRLLSSGAERYFLSIFRVAPPAVEALTGDTADDKASARKLRSARSVAKERWGHRGW